MIAKTTPSEARICQGDIIRNVHYIEDVVTEGDWIDVRRILFPYVIILTQDCDLLQDHNVRWPTDKIPTDQDKRILSALVAPLYNAEHVFTGEHLSDLRLPMQKINKKKSPGQLLMQNSNPRYHFLKFGEEVELVDSVIDFKHYFSANIEHLKRIKEQQFICKINSLYREDISQRFAAFLSRIGLPNHPEQEQPI